MKGLILAFVLLFSTVGYANADEKYYLVNFTATWCGPCHQMDMAVWRNSNFKEKMSTKKVVFSRVDIDKYPRVAYNYRIKAVPSTVLVKVQDGKTIEIKRIVGSVGLNFVLQLLDGVNNE